MATETIDNVGSADTPNREIHEQLGRKYAAGFVTDIESESFSIDPRAGDPRTFCERFRHLQDWVQEWSEQVESLWDEAGALRQKVAAKDLGAMEAQLDRLDELMASARGFKWGGQLKYLEDKAAELGIDCD